MLVTTLMGATPAGVYWRSVGIGAAAAATDALEPPLAVRVAAATDIVSSRELGQFARCAR